MSKKKLCDGCCKMRNDVQASKIQLPDGSWEFDVAAYCFICRKEWESEKFQMMLN